MTAIAPWAERYVGLPWHPEGRARLTGTNCYGLLCVVFFEVWGVRLPLHDEQQFEGVGYEALGAAFLKYRAEDHWLPIAAGAEQLGDIPLFRIHGHPAHVGLVVGRGWMLHQLEGANSCLERYNELMWQRRLLGFYRHRALGPISPPSAS